MPSEKCDVRIEVFEDHLLLIFPRKMDNFISYRDDMEQLATILKQAAGDLSPPLIVNPLQDNMEQEQIKIKSHGRHRLCLFFHWTDRIKLGPRATVMVAGAILLKCQNLRYEEKGIHLAHGPAGRIYNRKFLGNPKKLGE